MSVVYNFIRHCSAKGLQEYLSYKHIATQAIDWLQDKATVDSNVIQLLNHLPPEIQARLRIDAERIHQMSDEVGQAALFASTTKTMRLARMESSFERSRWMYLNQPDCFRHAEDIRYADQYRYGRNWSSYKTEASLPLHTDKKTVVLFKKKLKSLPGFDNKIKIELFDRLIPGEEDNETSVVQAMIYQEGLPDAYLEFADEQHLVSRIRRPVSEYAVIYHTGTGIIEVVASKRDRRDTIASAFTETLLKQPLAAEKLPLRRYDLLPLLEEHTLDWDIEDGIQSVTLVMLRLRDTEGCERLQIEVPAKSPESLHAYVQKKFKEYNPLNPDRFIPTQAKINIHFRPDKGTGRGKVLPIKITSPNGCDLRSRTEKERLIGEKYLTRWGLIEEV